MDSLIPDNARFTSDNATDWERRLGLVTNLATSLANRKAAILRKMSMPEPNGHWLFLQGQLQAAGFDVYVYENRFPDYPDGYYEESPSTLYPAIMSQLRYGLAQYQQVRYGEFRYGKYINHIVVNSIYNQVDVHFKIANLRTTFFIGGPYLGDVAYVPASREIEFRQLILSLKQVQQAAILFIDYI